MRIIAPRPVSRPWGGDRLASLFPGTKPPIGEAYIHEGSSAPAVLIKWIDAKETLSIQNHPSQPGYSKRELWYFMEAPSSGTIVSGLKCRVSELAGKHAVENWLEHTRVSAGDFLELPAGRVHALTPGAFVLEIQEPLDITYRIHDWGRGRELHIKDAEASCTTEPVTLTRPPAGPGAHSIVARPEFHVSLVNGPVEWRPGLRGVLLCVRGPRKLVSCLVDPGEGIKVDTGERWVWCERPES